MHNKNWKDEILTVPNLLSLFRLALIPIYITIYLNAQSPNQFHIAGLILFVSCLTDFLDGKIARRFQMVSAVGKILDPMADKITQFTLILCLTTKHPELTMVLFFFTVKELFQAGLGIYYLHFGKILPGAIMAGKVCTVVLFVSLTILVFYPAIPDRLIRLLVLADMIFLGISFAGYCWAYWGKDTQFHMIGNEKKCSGSN